MRIKRVFRIINDREIESVDIEINEFNRASYKEKQNYVRILHKKFNDIYKNEKVLEISTKSPIDLGKKLSAFNLEYEIKNKKYLLECVFQSSKAFKNGELYKDFLLMEPVDVKSDKRLKIQGELV